MALVEGSYFAWFSFLAMPSIGVPAEPRPGIVGMRPYFLRVGQYWGAIRSMPWMPIPAAMRQMSSRVQPLLNEMKKPGTMATSPAS